MDDLRHWNFPDHFTAKEVASLVVGVDPGADDQNKRVPVLRRITQAYGKAENTMNAAATFGIGLDEWLKMCPFDDDALLSEQMLLVTASKEHYGLDCYADNCPDFSFAFFTRTEICRWLKAIGLKSAYRFDKCADELVSHSDLQPATHWPWGNRTTKYLMHLEAAAQEHWREYDPLKPTSAPKSENVIRWLTGRGVSKKVSEVIATMLRPEDLPKGPRKK